MLVCGVYCVKLFIQVGSSVSLDPSVFPFQDMRYKGVNGGKTGTKPKQKKGCKLATKFAQPMTSIQSGTSASDSDGKRLLKGEKDKPKRKATPPVSPVLDGAVGGNVNGESSTDETSGGDPPPSLKFTKESVAKLKAHLGESKGECRCVLLVVNCCAGVDRCRMCRGRCCALVNSVINALTEQGELDPDAEVVLSVVLVFFNCYVI